MVLDKKVFTNQFLAVIFPQPICPYINMTLSRETFTSVHQKRDLDLWYCKCESVISKLRLPPSSVVKEGSLRRYIFEARITLL